MIENLKMFLKDVDKLNECVALAINFHSLDHDPENSKNVSEILEITKRIGEHLQKQLVKGIKIEEELDELSLSLMGISGIEPLSVNHAN